MPALRDPRLELFSQELALALNEGVASSAAAARASERAGYPPSDNPDTFAANSRKRAQRSDVGKRVAELRLPGIRRAEAAIGITTEYLLDRLHSIVEFNLDDYLGEPDENGERGYSFVGVPRDLLGRLANAKLGKVIKGRGKSRRMLNYVADVSGHDPIQALKLMAQIKGLMAPEKRDLTFHATDQMTDDELARIAAGGSPRNPAAPVNP